MSQPLRILLIEDEEADAELIARQLAKAGLVCEIRRVASLREFEGALEAELPDVVLSDYNLPGVKTESLLELAKSRMPDIPFIIVSGGIGEERAVELVREGATDYVHKDRLGRLAPSVARAVREARGRAEQRAMEAELRYRLDREEILVGNLPMALYDAHPETLAISRVTSSFTRITGHESEALLREARWLSFVHPDDLPALERRNEAVRKRGSAAAEYRFRCADGSYRWVLDQMVLKEKVDDRRRICAGFLIDVTDRRRLEEKFAHSQKLEAIGRLAGGVAHDFNNMLTAILGYCELVLPRMREDDPNRADVEEIRAAGERAATLTQQLLAVSRKQTAKPAALDLKEVVLGMERTYRRLIGEDVEFAAVARPDAGLVMADRGQLEQVVLNLVVNARDAMPKGGKLTIETAELRLDDATARAASVAPGLYVMLAVTDTGTGMSEDVKSHLFEPFFTTKEVGKGTGLGLSTVHGIVRENGGHVSVYSEPGQGTTVKVFLPKLKAAPALEAAAPPRPRAKGGTETVLIVEDDEGVRRLASRVLRSAGYTVLEARNGEEALEVVEGHGASIQLLLSDLIMPKLGGPELVQRLAVRHGGIKVLLMSGYPGEASLRLAPLTRSVAFIGKPLSPVELLLKVRETLDAEPVPNAG